MAGIDGGITLEVAQQNLDDAVAALAKSRVMQSYAVSSTTGGRTTVRGAHDSLLTEVIFWRKEVARLQRAAITGGGPRIRGGVPA